MKNLLLLFLGTTIIFMAACTQSGTKTTTDNETKADHNDLYFANDMENISQWGQKSDISKGEGHSGKYFSKADKNSPYSFGLSSSISELTSKKIKKVDTKVWVSVANKDYKGGLICSIFRNDSTIFWTSSNLKDFISEPGKWCEVRGNYELPDDLQQTDRIAIYIWNSGDKCDIYADDFEIQFSE